MRLERDFELGAVGREAQRRDRPADVRAARHAVEAGIAERHAVGRHAGLERLAAPRAREAAHLEDVGVVGVELEGEAQQHRGLAEVRDDQLLVARGIAQEPRARDVDRPLEDRERVALVHIGIGHVHRERAVVAAHVGVEQDRSLAVEPHLVAREEARALVVEAMLAASHARDVAEAVEEDEALAVLEHPCGVARACGCREHVPAILDADRLVGKLDRLHAAAARIGAASSCARSCA